MWRRSVLVPRTDRVKARFIGGDQIRNCFERVNKVKLPPGREGWVSTRHGV